MIPDDPVKHLTAKQLRIIFMQMSVSDSELANRVGLFKQNISETRLNMSKDAKNGRIYRAAAKEIRKVVKRYLQRAKKRYPDIDPMRFMPLDL